MDKDEFNQLNEDLNTSQTGKELFEVNDKLTSGTEFSSSEIKDDNTYFKQQDEFTPNDVEIKETPQIENKKVLENKANTQVATTVASNASNLSTLLIVTSIAGGAGIGVVTALRNAAFHVELFSKTRSSLVFDINAVNVTEDDIVLTRLYNGDYVYEEEYTGEKYCTYSDLQPDTEYTFELLFNDKIQHQRNYTTSNRDETVFIEVGELTDNSVSFVVTNNGGYPFITTSVYSKSGFQYLVKDSTEINTEYKVENLDRNQFNYIAVKSGTDGLAFYEIPSLEVEPEPEPEPEPPTPEVIHVESVSLDVEVITLIAGGAGIQLNATVLPENATDKSVVFSTDRDTTCITVSETGFVAPVSEGRASVMVTTVDGNFTASCNVIVEAAAPGAFTVTKEVENIKYNSYEAVFSVSDSAGIDNITVLFDREEIDITWSSDMTFSFAYEGLNYGMEYVYEIYSKEDIQQEIPLYEGTFKTKDVLNLSARSTGDSITVTVDEEYLADHANDDVTPTFAISTNWGESAMEDYEIAVGEITEVSTRLDDVLVFNGDYIIRLFEEDKEYECYSRIVNLSDVTKSAPKVNLTIDPVKNEMSLTYVSGYNPSSVLPFTIKSAADDQFSCTGRITYNNVSEGNTTELDPSSRFVDGYYYVTITDGNQESDHTIIIKEVSITIDDLSLVSTNGTCNSISIGLLAKSDTVSEGIEIKVGESGIDERDYDSYTIQNQGLTYNTQTGIVSLNVEDLPMGKFYSVMVYLNGEYSNSCSCTIGTNAWAESDTFSNFQVSEFGLKLPSATVEYLQGLQNEGYELQVEGYNIVNGERYYAGTTTDVSINADNEIMGVAGLFVYNGSFEMVLQNENRYVLGYYSTSVESDGFEHVDCTLNSLTRSMTSAGYELSITYNGGYAYNSSDRIDVLDAGGVLVLTGNAPNTTDNSVILNTYQSDPPESGQTYTVQIFDSTTNALLYRGTVIYSG